MAPQLCSSSTGLKVILSKCPFPAGSSGTFLCAHTGFPRPRQDSRNVGSACRKKVRIPKVCGRRDYFLNSTAKRISSGSRLDESKLGGPINASRAAANSFEVRSPSAISEAGQDVPAPVRAWIGIQATSRPLTLVQQTFCSLILAVALLLPGPALAEEVSGSPLLNDALRDLPSKDASLDQRVKKLNELTQLSLGVGQALSIETRFPDSHVKASASRLDCLESTGCRRIGGAGALQSGGSKGTAPERITGRRALERSIEPGSKEWLESYAPSELHVPKLKQPSYKPNLALLAPLVALDQELTQQVELPAVNLAGELKWGAGNVVFLQSSATPHRDHQFEGLPSILWGQHTVGSSLRKVQLQNTTTGRSQTLSSSFVPVSVISVQSSGSPSRTAGRSLSQFGSLGSIAGPVHIVSQRPRSSRLINPVFQEHQRALHRKNRRNKVAVAALPGANQALNQGVGQALSYGSLNQFAELAVGAAKKAFNVGVLGATAGASLKLFTVCGRLKSFKAHGYKLEVRNSFLNNICCRTALVVWMQKSGRLPETTPAVLSQVAFRLLIPCFLMSKVAVTLYSDFSPALLAVPIAAVVQILLGAGMGRLAAHFAYRQPPLVPAHFEAHEPTRASSLVAASVAIATGQPDVAVALTAPKGVGTAKLGASKEALMTATSAFGNSLTLPLVFLSALLDRAGADKAAGYLALYMVGWSPALWTFGYKIIAGSSDEPDSADDSDYEGEGRWQAFLTWLGRVMNPPLYGVFLGLIIGATPLAHLFLPPATAAAENLANATSISPLTVLATLTSGIFRPVMEAASLLGTATLAVQTVVLASSLAASIPSRLHSLSADSQSLTPSPAVNPNPLTEVLREGEGPVDSTVGDAGSQIRQRRRGVRLKQGPDAANMLDGRAVWVVSGVRLLLLPLVNLFLTLGLMRAHILPADPICGLVLMAEAAMPSAQNLVLLAQLKAKTRPLAGMVAGLLLRQYALSILPITFWMAIFLSVLGLAT